MYRRAVFPRYNKSLRLSTCSRAKYSQGEIVNLMEVDSQKFQDITSYICILLSIADICKQSGRARSKSSVR